MTEKLITLLSDLNEKVRKESFGKIVSLIKKGKIKRNNAIKPWINLHIHTFHSYNYNNWSPSRIVFEGWKTGLKYVGTVDFDTLAAVDETLFAGKLLDVKVLGGFESRVFIDEMKDVVINSPKEPGIYYLCGKGFLKSPDDNSEAGKFFGYIKGIAQKRNREVIEKLNEYLGEVRVDYYRDVLPLTPSDNPTERHITEAYQRKSEEVMGEKVDIFWSDILKMGADKIRDTRTNKRADFQELLRKVLIKYGGPGYMPPEKKNFPSFDETVRMIEKAGGIPVGTWLDGTSNGEQDPEKLLEFLSDKGIKAIAIIPDRNYNIKDKEEQKLKIRKLDEFITVCQKMKMPVVCGTEMNKFGQPFVDDFTNPVLKRYLSYFHSSAELFFKKREEI
ncbi:MAG: hypothetical protein NC929_03705 [Candidatus Omnitrophica bacterium]|nr:hypothetical protein [Candidatus Omnitrophota bacterium]